MTSLSLVLYPNLKTSSMKVSHLLNRIGGGYEALLLDLPREMEDIVAELASERISYDELVDDACRSHLIPEPIGSWEYAKEPILKDLPQLSRKFPNLKTYCYGSIEHEFASMDVAVRLARLILRTALTGVVDVDEWTDTLSKSLHVDREAITAEVGVILERIEDSYICVSDMGGRGLKRPLTRAGLDICIHYVEKPHHFTPLMVLKRKMAKGPIMEEEVEELVRYHVEYVRSYIYRFKNRDRAYYEWVYDKIPWVRRKINKEEVKILNSVIQQS